MIPRLRTQLREKRKDRDRTRGQQGASSAQTVGPKTFQPTFLPHDDFTRCEEDHDERRKRGPKWRDGSKQKRQHISDEHQLNQHACGRDGKLALKLEMKSNRQNSIHYDEKRRQREVAVR